MTTDRTWDGIKDWARRAARGERFILIAEADGAGDAIWTTAVFSAEFSGDRKAWSAHLAGELEDALISKKIIPVPETGELK
jgi:hypothetical protein